MDAAGARGCGDVWPVVDEQAGLAPAREPCGLRRQLKESVRGKIFFAELNEGNALCDGGGDEL